MIAKSGLVERRRRVAQLLADGQSTNEIARALGVRWDVAEADIQAVKADPNNIDYLSPKRALGRLLDGYDTLEREAREHLALAIQEGKLDSANRWFESIRRITEDRGRVLHQIGVLNRAARQAASTQDEGRPGPRLSPRARKLVARVMLAEKLGHAWTGELSFQEPAALEPEPDPDFVGDARPAVAAPVASEDEP